MDVTYRVIGDKAAVYLFGRTKEGKQIGAVDKNFEPYFYVIPKQGKDIEDKLMKIAVDAIGGKARVVRVEKIKRHFLGRDVEGYKIFTQLPRDVPLIREVVKDWDAVELCAEYDIPFWKRYIIDKGIIPFSLVTAEASLSDEKAKVPIFHLKTISRSEETILEKPKILAFDIETYSPPGRDINHADNAILLVSCYGERLKKVITWKKFPTKAEGMEFVESEAELLEKFISVINSYKPDILCGYFSDGFDLPFIKGRAEKLKVRLNLGLDDSEMTVERRRFTTADIVGINHVDIYRFIKKALSGTMETGELSLDEVSKELLGEKKIEVDVEELYKIWDKHPEKLGPYAEYNLHDSYLTYKLTEKLLPNILELTRIVGLPLPEMVRVGFSQLVESYILRRAFEMGELAPGLPHDNELGKRNAETYVGGFVHEPKPGLFKDIVVFDFRSLYPSVISSHNIDPGTLCCPCCSDKTPAPIEGGKKKIWFCSKHRGFLPKLIDEIISARVNVLAMLKKEKNPFLEARSYSLKILANAFYGYLGFPMARWYSHESAMATSGYGRFYIKRAISLAESRNFPVIYSDTDSVFLTLSGKTKNDALAFREDINKELPGIMELEFQGFYPRGIFVSAKVGKFGAKKKYALIDENGILKIRGFETVRRNWSPIAKRVQEEVLGIVLKEENPKKAIAHVRDVVEMIRKHQLPIPEVTISTQLTKELKSYENHGPHVAIAEKMKRMGIIVSPGAIIKYVVTKGADRIRDRAKLPEEITQKDYDPDYYINNQVLPAVERIFEALGYAPETVLEGKSQEKLGKFFS